MRVRHSIAAALFALALSLWAPFDAQAADRFADVPRDHWAYKFLERATEAGLIEGDAGKFHGKRTMSRYEMATVLGRILARIGSTPGNLAKISPADLLELQELVVEFGEELITVTDKVDRIASEVRDMSRRLEGLETELAAAPAMTGGGGGGVAQAMTGFLSVGLVKTDKGANNLGGGYTRYHLPGSTTLDQTFFTLPQASIAIHHSVSPETLLHVQFDYTTNADNPVGGGVGLNEAYLGLSRFSGVIGGKVGGFAFPFSDWEFDGPFRSLTKTITPSLVNSFLERFRVVGMELAKTQDVDEADTHWRLALFSGNDLPVTAAGDLLPVPSQDDSVGLGGLSRSATFDGDLGFYLDIESGDAPHQKWGWRVGYFDIGGDLGATAPKVASQQFDGFNLGAWWRRHRLKVTGQYARADRKFVQQNFPAADAGAGYLLAHYELSDSSSVAARFDKFDFKDGTIQNGGVAGGQSFLLAWNRSVTETSLLQFEYLNQEQTYPPRAIQFPQGLPDPADDLVQLRYKVWF